MSTLKLAAIPLPAKLLATAFVMQMSLNHIFAGWLSWEISHSAAGSAREHFQYKNLVYLLRMSHQHTFGHGVMYSLTAFLFLFCSWPDKLKSAVVLIPFIGATADLSAWWLLKYASGDCEWLSILGGTLFSLGFAAMVLAILHELWIKKTAQQS